MNGSTGDAKHEDFTLADYDIRRTSSFVGDMWCAYHLAAYLSIPEGREVEHVSLRGDRPEPPEHAEIMRLFNQHKEQSMRRL